MPSSAIKNLALAVVFATVPSIANAALVPRASGVPPTCHYECKPVDDNGNNYRGPGYVGSVLFKACSYYHDDANNMRQSDNCVYWLSTGKLEPGLTSTLPIFRCPAEMDQVCTSAPDRRDVNGVYKAYQKRRERRAAMPAPTVPQHMVTRASLKKRNTVEDLD